MMHLRDRLKIKAVRSGDAIDWNNFKRSCNNVNNAILKLLKSPIIRNLLQLVSATHARPGRSLMR